MPGVLALTGQGKGKWCSWMVPECQGVSGAPFNGHKFPMRRSWVWTAAALTCQRLVLGGQKGSRPTLILTEPPAPSPWPCWWGAVPMQKGQGRQPHLSEVSVTFWTPSGGHTEHSSF